VREDWGGYRGTEFVGEQADRLPRPPSSTHHLIEAVITAGGCPAGKRCADHGVARVDPDNPFSFDLGFRVNAQRTYRVRFLVIPLKPIEDQIRGQKDELNVGAQPCQHTGNLDIDPARKAGIHLAIRGPSERGAVNNELGMLACKRSLHLQKISEVQGVPFQANCLPLRGIARGSADQIVTNQSTRTRNPSQWLC
jgi:hypothetical protein